MKYKYYLRDTTSPRKLEKKMPKSLDPTIVHAEGSVYDRGGGGG